MRAWMIVVPLIISALAMGGWFGWSKIEVEHREARSLTLNAVDFSRLNDGVYHGYYEGGMYRWRMNECDVTVRNGRVVDIRLAGSEDPGADNTDFMELYARVIEAQSLRVDSISGATLTSLAYLQAVENALIPAQKE